MDIILATNETKNIGPISMDYIGGDQTSPQMVSVYPAAGVTQVDVNTSIEVTFNEPLAPSSVVDDAVSLMNGTTAVPGLVSYNPANYTISFTPQGLSVATTYTIILKATAADHVTDTAGLGLVGDFSWQFTTAGGSADTTPPQIISVAPVPDAGNVDLDVTLQAAFSEPMDPDSLNDAVFTLSSAQGAVAAAVTYMADSRTTMLTPAASLAPATQYTATVSTGARDMSGNALGAPYSWDFITLRTYTISASVDLDNENGGTISPAGATVIHGDNQTFTIQVTPYYHLAELLVDGIQVAPVSSYTFTNVASDHTIQAVIRNNAKNISEGLPGNSEPQINADGQVVWYGGDNNDIWLSFP